MRLAVFTNQFPARVSTFFAHDMSALVRASIDVDVFPIYPLDASLWKYVPSLPDGGEVLPTRVHHLDLGQALQALRPWPLARFLTFLGDSARVATSTIPWGFLPLLKTAYALPKVLAWASNATGQYDHVLSYWGNYAGTCAMLFHRLLRRPIPFSMFLHAGTDLYRYRAFLRQKLLYADGILVVCQFNREFLRQCYPDIFHRIANKIHLHHLGLDLDRFPFRPQGRPRHKVIAVGDMSKAKGFDVLLRALHHVVEHGTEVEAEIVGDGEELKTLESLAETLGLGRRVRFPGWLRPAEVSAAMSSASLLVHPSIGLGDAVPTVIKEAMALGTPVIASNVAGIPELLDQGRCGVLVPPRDVDALATAIATMLADDALRQKHAVAARRFVEETFDLQKNGARLAELLKSMTPQRQLLSHQA